MKVIDNPLFHPTSDINITPEILLCIRAWWAKFNSFTLEQKSRIKNGLSFYLNGLSGTEMTRFSNLYLFLDSIYGVNGNVENSIKTALAKKLPDTSEDLISDFWNLRCDILHGGIDRVHRWKDFLKFLKTHSTDPTSCLNHLCNKIICNNIY